MPPENIISYEAMQIIGLSYEDAVSNGYKPTIMSYEESKEANSDLIESKGITEEQYAEIHNTVLDAAKLKAEQFNSSGKFQENVSPTAIQNQHLAPKPMSTINPAFVGLDPGDYQRQVVDTENIQNLHGVSLYDSYGQLFRTMNEEQEAESNGYYIDQDGMKQNLDEYQAMDYQGYKFRTDPKTGKKKMLILGKNPLNPTLNMYKEVDADKFHKGSIVRSMHGPTEVRSSALANGWDNAVNTTIDMTIGTASTIFDMIGAVDDWYRDDGEEGYLSRRAAIGQNYTNIRKSKISEFAKSQKFWDEGWTGKAGVIGSSGAQILGMMGVARLFGMGALKLGAKANTANMLAKGSSYLFGAGYAAHAMNEEGKEMGIERGDRLQIALGAAGVVMIAERMLDAAGASGFVNKVIGEKTKREKLVNNLNETLSAVYKESVPALKAATTQAEKDAISNSIIKKASTEFFKKLGFLGGALSKAKNLAGRAVQAGRKAGGARRLAANILDSGTEEGAEEVIEEWGNFGLQFAYDNFFSQTGASVGDGLYGAKAPTLSDMQEAFTGGFIGGSFGGVARTLGNYDQEVELTNNNIAEIAANHNSREEAQKFLADQHKSFILENPLLTEDGRVIATLPKAERDVAKSKNDIKYEALKQQLDLAWDTKVNLGLHNNAENIANLMGGDVALMQDAIKLALDEKHYGAVYDQMATERISHKEDSPEYSEYTKKMEDLKAVTSDKKRMHESITSGELYSQYQANMLSSSLIFNRQLRDTKDASLEKLYSKKRLNKDDKLQLNTAYTNALSNAENDVNFNNQKNAYYATQHLKNISDKNIIDTEAIQKLRLEDAQDTDEDVNKKLDSHIDSVKSEQPTDFNEILGSIEQIEADSAEAGLTESQAKKADSLLKSAQKHAIQELGKIDEAFDKMPIGDMESFKSESKSLGKEATPKALSEVLEKYKKLKANVGPGQYDQKLNLLGDRSPMGQQQLDEILELQKKSNRNILTSRKKKVKSYLYIPKGRTIKNQYGDEVLTNLVSIGEVSEDYEWDQEQNVYVTRTKGEKTELVGLEELNDDALIESYVQDGWEYSKEAQVDGYYVEGLETRDKDNNIILDPSKANTKPLVLQGMKLSAEEHALMQNIITDSDNNPYGDKLAGIDESLRSEKQSPSEDLRQQLISLQNEISDKQRAIQLAIHLKQLDALGLDMNPLAKNALGWETWNSHSEEFLSVAYKLLNNNFVQADLIISMMENISNARKEVFDKYRLETRKINAETHNILQGYFNTKDENGNSNAYYYDEKGNKKVLDINDFPTFNLTTTEPTEEEVAKTKQFWHVFFNAKDSDGDYFNIYKNGKFTDEFNTFVEKHIKTSGSNNQAKVGNFSTGVSSFTLENFKESFGSDKLKKGDVSFREMYLMHYVNDAININPFDFNTEFRAVTAKIDENDKIVDEKVDDKVVYKGRHNPEQKKIIESVSGFLNADARAKKDVKFKELNDELRNKLFQNLTGLSDNLMSKFKSNVYTILGNAGTGKTSFGTKTIMQIANNLGALPKKIVLVAKNNDQINNLKKNAKDAGIPDNRIEAVLFDKYYEDNRFNKDRDTLIIFDEYTLVHTGEMNSIFHDLSSDIYKGKSLHDSNQLIILGDVNQSPPDPLLPAAKVRMKSMFFMNMVTVMRTGLLDINNLQDYFRAEIEYNQGNYIQPYTNSSYYNYNEEENKYKGVRVMNNAAEHLAFAKDRVNNHGATIIVFDKETKKDLEDEGWTGSIKTIADAEFSPQGAEFDEIHVHIPFQENEYVDNKYIEDGMPEDNLKRYMLTAVSRGKEFVSIYMDGKESKTKAKLEESVDNEELLENGKKEQAKENNAIVNSLLSDIDSSKSPQQKTKEKEEEGKSTYPIEPEAEAEAEAEAKPKLSIAAEPEAEVEVELTPKEKRKALLDAYLEAYDEAQRIKDFALRDDIAEQISALKSSMPKEEVLENDISKQEEKILELQPEVNLLNNQIADFNQIIDNYTEDIKRFEAEENPDKELIAQYKKERGTTKGQRTRLQKKLKAAEIVLSEYKDKLKELMDELAVLRGEQTYNEDELDDDLKDELEMLRESLKDDDTEDETDESDDSKNAERIADKELKEELNEEQGKENSNLEPDVDTDTIKSEQNKAESNVDRGTRILWTEVQGSQIPGVVVSGGSHLQSGFLYSFNDGTNALIDEIVDTDEGIKIKYTLHGAQQQKTVTPEEFAGNIKQNNRPQKLKDAISTTSFLLANEGLLSVTGHQAIAYSDDVVNKDEYNRRLMHQNLVLSALKEDGLSQFQYDQLGVFAEKGIKIRDFNGNLKTTNAIGFTIPGHVYLHLSEKYPEIKKYQGGNNDDQVIGIFDIDPDVKENKDEVYIGMMNNLFDQGAKNMGGANNLYAFSPSEIGQLSIASLIIQEAYIIETSKGAESSSLQDILDNSKNIGLVVKGGYDSPLAIQTDREKEIPKKDGTKETKNLTITTLEIGRTGDSGVELELEGNLLTKMKEDNLEEYELFLRDQVETFENGTGPATITDDKFIEIAHFIDTNTSTLVADFKNGATYMTNDDKTGLVDTGHLIPKDINKKVVKDPQNNLDSIVRFEIKKHRTNKAATPQIYFSDFTDDNGVITKGVQSTMTDIYDRIFSSARGEDGAANALSLRFASQKITREKGSVTLDTSSELARKNMVFKGTASVISGLVSVKVDPTHIYELAKGNKINPDDYDYNSIDRGDNIQSPQVYEFLRNDANSALAQILGDTHIQSFGGFRFGKLPQDINGRQIHGQINNRAVMTLNMLEDGSINLQAAFHEIIHFIDFFLMDDKQRTDIYQEVANRTGKQGKEAAEYLADMGAAWMYRRKRLPNWSQKMFHFLDWLTYNFRKLSSILGVSNLMERTWYESFYQNKFANQTMLRAEAPQFDILYSKDRRALFSFVRKFYPKNRPIAALSQMEKVLSYTSKKMIEPSLRDAAVTEQGDFDYTEIVDDLEYHWREKAIIEVIKENIEVAKLGGASQYVFDVRYVKGKNKNNIDSLADVYKIGIWNKRLKIHEYAKQDSKGRWFNENRNSRNKIRNILKNVYKNNKIEISKNTKKHYNDDNIIDEFETLSSEDKIKYTQVKMLDDNFLFGMINKKFPGLKLGDVKTQKDGIFYDEVGITDQKTLEEQNQTVQNTVSKQESFETNPMDRMSDMLKLSVSQVPHVNDFTFDKNKDLKVIKANTATTQNAYIDLDELDPLLVEIASKIDPENMGEMGKGDLFMFQKRIKAALKPFFDDAAKVKDGKMTEDQFKSNYGNNKTVKHLFAFYDNYFNDESFSQYKILEYSQKIRMHQHLINAGKNRNNIKLIQDAHKDYVKITGDNISEADFQGFVLQKSQTSEMLLNAIVTNYKNIHKPQYKKVNFHGDYTRIDTISSETTDQYKYKINNSIKDFLVDSSGLTTTFAEAMFVKGHNLRLTKDKENPVFSKFIFKKDGIYFNTGVAMDTSDIKSKKELAKKGIVKIVDIDVSGNTKVLLGNKSLIEPFKLAKSFIGEFGLNNLLSNSNGIFAKLAHSEIGEEDTGFETFTDIFTKMMLSGYVFTRRNLKSQEGTITKLGHTERYENALKKLNKGTTYGKTSKNTLMSVGKSSEVEDTMEEEGDTTYNPLAFRKEITKLADVYSHMYGGASSKFFKNINGKKIMLSLTSNDISKNLKNGNSLSLANKFVARVFNNRGGYKNGENGEPIDHNTSNHEINNPVFNNNPRETLVDKTYYIEGYQTSSYAGKEIAQFTERDNYDMHWDLYYDSVKNNFINGISDIQMTSQSDRGRQYQMAVRMRIAGLTNTENSNGLVRRIAVMEGDSQAMDKFGNPVWSYEYDETTILEGHINNEFKIQQKLQKNSLNRWIRFFKQSEKHGKNFDFIHKEEIIPLKPGAKVDEVIAQNRLIKEIYEDLKEYLAQEEVISGISQNDFINFQDMKSSVDYVIYTSKDPANKNMQKIAPGWDTSMNAPIYREGKSGAKYGPTKTINYQHYNKKYKFSVEDGKATIQRTRYSDESDGVYTLGEILLIEGSNGIVVPEKFYDAEGKERTKKDFYRYIIEEVMFKDQIADSHRHIAKAGYYLPQDVYGETEYGQKPGIKNSDNQYDQIWMSNIIGHQLMNDYLMYALRGTYATNTNYMVNIDNNLPVQYNINNTKRLANATSPNTVGTFGGYRDLDKRSNVIIIEDPVAFVDIFNSTSDQKITDAVELFDGQAKQNPFVTEMLYNSMGKSISVMNKRAMHKSIAPMRNIDTGQVTDIKAATDKITAQTMEWMPKQLTMMKMFLNPEKETQGSLYHIFEDAFNKTGSFDAGVKAAAEAYFDARAKEKNITEYKNPYKYISAFVFDSSVKSKSMSNPIPVSMPFGQDSKNAGKSLLRDEQGYTHNDIFSLYENSFNPGVLKYATTFEHTQDGIQLNANKVIDNNNEAPMTQLMSIILASPEQQNGQTKKAVDLFAELYDLALNDFVSLLSDPENIGKEIQKFDGKEYRNIDRLSDQEFGELLDSKFETRKTELTEEEVQEFKDLHNKVMSLAENGLKNSDDSTMLSRLVNDKNSSGDFNQSLDFSGVKTRAYQYIAAYMRDQVIKQKQSGMRLIQTSGAMIEIVEYIDPKTNIKSVFSVQAAKDYAIKKYGIALEEGVNFFTAKNRKEADEKFKSNTDGRMLFIKKPLDNFEIEPKDVEAQLGNLSEEEVQAYEADKKKLDDQYNIDISKIEAGLAYDGIDENSDIYEEVFKERTKKINSVYDNDLYKLYRNHDLNTVQRGQVIFPPNLLTKYGAYGLKGSSLSDIFRIWEGIDGEKQTETNLLEILKSPKVLSQFQHDKAIREKISDTLSDKFYNNFQQIELIKEGTGTAKKPPFILYDVKQNEDSDLKVESSPIMKDLSNRVKDNLSKFENDYRVAIDKKIKELTKLTTNKNFIRGLLAEWKKEFRGEYYAKAVSKAIGDSTSALMSINKALETISVRTPSGPGSGYAAEIVGWISDNGSNGYYNTRKNAIDGSDQDIDQNTAYTLAVTLRELGLKKEKTAKDVSNEILRFVDDYYMNPKNDIFTKAKVDIDPLKAAAKNAQSKMFYGQEHANGLAHSVINRISTFKGKIVGPFALGQKTTTFLFVSGNLNGQPILNKNIKYQDEATGKSILAFDLDNALDLENYHKVATGLETQVNGATDNPKLMLLGVVNIGKENAWMVNAMFTSYNDVISYMEDRGRKEPGDPDKKLTHFEAIYKLLTSNANQDAMKQMDLAASIKSKYSKQTYSAVLFSKYNKIQENKGQIKDTVKRQKGQLLSLKDELEETLTSKFRFDIDDINNSFRYDKDGNFLGANLSDSRMDKNHKSIYKLRQSIFRSIDKAREQASKDFSESEELEEEAEGDYVTDELNEAKVRYMSKDVIDEVESLDNSTFDESLISEEDMKRVISLSYQIERKQKEINKRNRILSETYQSDLFQLAKYSMLGDWESKTTTIVNLNQGTPISPHRMKNLENTLKFMTGYELGEFLEKYKEFKDSRKDSASEWLNEYGLTKDEIKNRAFDQYKHRMTSSSYDWMQYDISKKKKYVTFLNGNNEPQRAIVDAAYMKRIDQQGDTLPDNYNPIETINYYDMFHKLGDLTAALFSMPHVMGQLKAAAVQKLAFERTTVTGLPVIKATMDDLLDAAGKDSFNEFQYNTFEEEVDKFMTAEFFADSKTKDIFKENYEALQANGVPPMFVNVNNDITINVDVSDAINRRLFVKSFAEYFFDKIIPKYNLKTDKNEAVRNLIDSFEIQTYNGEKYLGIKQGGLNLSSDQIIKMQEGFANLPPEVQKMIEMYQVAKGGFRYSSSALSHILSLDINEMFSKFTDKYKEQYKFGYSPAFRKRLQVFTMDLISKPKLRLLNYSRVAKDKRGRTLKRKFVNIDGKVKTEPIIIPPSSAYGFAKYFYQGLYFKWTNYGPKSIVATAIQQKATGFGVAKKAGNKIDVSKDSEFYLNPNKIIDEKGFSMMAKIAESFGYLNNWKRGQVAKALKLEKPDINDAEASMAYDQAIDEALENSTFSPSDINQQAKYYTNNLTLNNKNLQYVLTNPKFSEFVSFDEKNPNITNVDYAGFNNMLYNEYKEMMLYHIKENPERFIEEVILNEGNVFVDPKMNSKNNAAYILSMIANEYLTLVDYFSNPLAKNALEGYFGETKEEQVQSAAIQNLGELSEERIAPGFEYKYFRNKLGDFAISYDHGKQNAFDMNHKSVEKEVLPFFQTLNNDIKEKKVRELMREYALELETIKQRGLDESAAIGLLMNNQKFLDRLHKDINVPKTTIQTNLIEIFSQLANNQQWSELNINNQKTLKHAKIVKEPSTFNALSNSVKIERVGSHYIRIGDKILLPDGAVGIVTYNNTIPGKDNKGSFSTRYKYKVLPTQSQSIKRNNRLRSRLTAADFANHTNAKVATYKIVKSLSRSTPGIKYNFINQEEAESMGEGNSNSFVSSDGIVYINIDKADAGVALHEFAHPISFFLEKDNNKLWKALENGLKDSLLEDDVKKLYPELKNRRDLTHEVIPTFLQQQSYNKKEAGLLKKVFNWFRNFIRKKLGLSPYSAINKLNLEIATIQEIADAIIEDMMMGREITNMTSAELSEMLPYNAQSKGIIGMSNVDQLHTLKPQGRVVNRLEKTIRSQVIKTIMDGNGYYKDPNGNIHNLNENAKKGPIFKFKNKGEFDYSKRAKEIDRIVSLVAKEGEKIKSKFHTFLDNVSNGNNIFESATQSKKSIKNVWKYRFKNKLEKEAQTEKLKNLLSKIGFNPKFDKAFVMQKHYKELYDNYGISLDKSLIGKNPLIIVHNHKSTTSKGKQISIIDVTEENITEPIAGITLDDKITIKKSKQGSAYFNKRALSDIYLLNNIRDLNFTSQTIQAMAIKQNNPDIHIKHIGTVQMIGDSSRVFLRRMKDTVPQVTKIFNHKKIQEQLDPNIKLVLNDNTVNTADSYKLEIVDVIKDYASTRLGLIANNDSSLDSLKSKKIFNDMLESVVNYEAQKDGLKGQRLANLILEILAYKRSITADKTKLDYDDEYLQLSEAYMRLMSLDQVSEINIRSLSQIELWAETADRYDDDYRTFVLDQIDIALRKSRNIEYKFQSANNLEISKLNNVVDVLSITGDKAKKLFEPLFIKKEVSVLGIDNEIVAGKKKLISLNEIHWDKDAIETKKALANKTIDMNYVNYGKFLMDQFEKEFIEHVAHKNYSKWAKDLKGKKDITEKEIREYVLEKAADEVSHRWKKGMVPAIKRRSTAALEEGSKKEAFDLYMKSVMRDDGAFDEYFEGENENGTTGRYRMIPAHMWSQFEDGGALNHGGENRLLRMGLMKKNGELVLISEDQQRNLSYNLQDIGNYTVASSARSRSFDDAINAANTGIDLLRGIAANTGIDTLRHIKQLQVNINRNLYGELPKHGRQKIAGFEFSIDSAIHGTTTAITSITMGFSPRLAAKNMGSSQIKMLANGVANAWAKNGFFTNKEIGEAWSEMANNPMKISLLNQKYKIVSMTERDIMSHALHNKTKRHIKDADSIMGMHFAGAHITKLIAMTAQMIKDGTYYAHDNKGDYNPRKDSRFYTHSKEVNGKIEEYVDFSEMSEEGKIKMEFIKDRAITEDLYGQREDMNGELKGAYFGKQLNKIDVLIGRLVDDVTNPQHKNMLSAYGISKLAFALKSYMYSLPGEWAKKPGYDVSVGKLVTKEVDGVKKAVWEPAYVEGVLYTVASGIKEMYKYNLNAGKVWSDLKPYQKRNLGKLLSFSLTMGSIYVLWQMLTGGEEEEDKSGFVKTGDKIILGAVSEGWIQISPKQVYNDWKDSPNMFLLYGENMANNVAASFMLPFAMSDEGVASALDSYFYDMSKNVLGGTGARDFRMFFEDFINRLIAHLDNK